MSVRRARLEDTQAMLEITRDVWAGHDYVPRVWATWLSDHAGVLLVATAGGKMVGFQHVDIHPDGTAWLEGIRVLEEMQGAGIATRLLSAGLDWARVGGLSAARLCTSTDNPASNRLAQRAGMQAVARFASIRISASAQEQPGSVRLARPDELPAVRGTLEFWPDTPFYTEGWTAYSLTDERLRVLLASAQVVVHGDDNIDAIAIAPAVAEAAYPRPGLLRGTPEGTGQILEYLRRSLHLLGVASARGQLELRDGQWETAAAHGLERAWEHDMQLWQIALT